MTNNYKKLSVWKKSLDLVDEVYKVTALFPDDEKYGLVVQMKRAVVSIPSNIAEWSGRNSKDSFKQFLYIAKWSCYELESQVIIAKRLWFINEVDAKNLLKMLDEVIRMIQWLINFNKN